MKNIGFIKDALILCVITLISGLLLGGVYELTKEPIEEAQMAAKSEAYKEVFTDADRFSYDDSEVALIESVADTLLTQGFGNVVIDDVVQALDVNDAVIGHVVSVTSKDGYGGDVSISVGIRSDKTVNGIAFLTLNETPGLGMRAAEEEFYSQFANKVVELFTVTKSVASTDADIEAISGATITSNAVTNAVNAAIWFISQMEN